jgi:hypothetical protein
MPTLLSYNPFHAASLPNPPDVLHFLSAPCFEVWNARYCCKYTSTQSRKPKTSGPSQLGSAAHNHESPTLIAEALTRNDAGRRRVRGGASR